MKIYRDKKLGYAAIVGSAPVQSKQKLVERWIRFVLIFKIDSHIRSKASRLLSLSDLMFDLEKVPLKEAHKIYDRVFEEINESTVDCKSIH